MAASNLTLPMTPPVESTLLFYLGRVEADPGPGMDTTDTDEVQIALRFAR